MKVKKLMTYPIKSCGGLEHDYTYVGKKGLAGEDRRCMLVDENGKFISQRTHPLLSQVRVESHGFDYKVSYGGMDILLECIPATQKKMFVKIWNDVCEAEIFPSKTNDFFSEILGQRCFLVYMPDSEQTRTYDVSFSDVYHSLLISQSSVDLLNEKLGGEGKVSVLNFRPNIVIDNVDPHIEDDWVGEKIQIGNTQFVGNSVCARCVVPTIDPETSQKNPEVNKVLASYRYMKDPEKGIYFGLNLSPLETGELISVGDELKILGKTY